MLRKPRPLPQRFNRTVTPQTRRLVRRRHQTQTRYRWQKWKRHAQQWQRRMRALRPFFLRIAAGLVGVLIIAIICVAVFSPLLNVREIHVARSDGRLDTTLIQEALKPLFGRRMPFVAVEELPALLTTDIPAVHRSAVPDLSTVTISKEYPSTLQVRLTLRPITYRLSIESPDQKKPATLPQAGSGTDFLTADGLYVSYTLAQSKSGAVLPLLRIVDWSVKPSPWKPLLTKDFLDAMQQTEEALKTQFNQTVKSRTVFLRAREYHLQMQNLTLWFDLRSPLAEELDRYRLFLTTVPAGTAKEYVDLRINDKIIYK